MALNNVPLTGQSLSVTKVPINSNFSTINNAFAVDHVTMTPPGTASPQGFHNKVSLNNLAAVTPAFGTNINGIYNKTSLTGINETFWRSQSINGPFDFPVTANIFSTTPVPAPIGTVGQGWCYLPSGLTMKWGTFTSAAANPYVFPTTASTGSYIPPFATAVLSMQISVVNTGVPYGTIINTLNVGKLSFNWVATGTTPASFSYLAIGY